MNMNKDLSRNTWDTVRWKVLKWINKQRNVQFFKVNSLRERSIGTLQRRYGYTREQAIYQLDKHYPRAWLG